VKYTIIKHTFYIVKLCWNIHLYISLIIESTKGIPHLTQKILRLLARTKPATDITSVTVPYKLLFSNPSAKLHLTVFTNQMSFLLYQNKGKASFENFKANPSALGLSPCSESHMHQLWGSVC
jgi:hypothetical protein